MSRAPFWMGGVTLGCVVAFLFTSGLKKRSVATEIGSPRVPQAATTLSRVIPTREDVLERYRLAAAV